MTSTKKNERFSNTLTNKEQSGENLMGKGKRHNLLSKKQNG